VRPNTLYNPQETERRRADARDAQEKLRVVLSFRKGQNIVDRGHIITQRHLEIVQAMEGGGEDVRITLSQILSGTLLVVVILLVLLYLFSRNTIRKFSPQPRDLVLLGSIILFELVMLQGSLLTFEALGQGWSSVTPEALTYGIPLALGAIIVRLVLNSETALVYAVAMAVLAGLTVDQSLTYAAYVLVSSLTGAHAVGTVCHRMDLVKAGLRVGALNAIAAAAILLSRGEALSVGILWAAGAGFVGGLTSGILVNAVLPLVENLFRYTTDIKLLELADLNHPALKELILKAPGTYHHSVVVGTLAKEAAEAIHANPLLARVGAYYHDIGKGKNPQYFAENQRNGQNLHDKLKPNMSALIIKSHVKDGLELARQYDLPPEIRDFIAMHHGTTLISYFYHRAKSMEDPDIPEVDEKDYRYPGPKPQTRETAIVMLADGIEAASRAMPDPSAARIKGLVQTMINKLFADGQLDECELTLKDLNAIARAFIRVLTSMYHSRPKYPGQEKNPGARAAAARKQHTGEHKRKDPSSTTGERKRRRKKGQRDEEPPTQDGPGDDADTETITMERPRGEKLPGALLSTGEFAHPGPRTARQDTYIRMTGTMVAIPRPDDRDALADPDELSVDADSAGYVAADARQRRRGDADPEDDQGTAQGDAAQADAAQADAESDAESDTKKPDAKKPDAKKPDTKKPDTKKPDTKKPDTKKAEAKKPDAEEAEGDPEEARAQVSDLGQAEPGDVEAPESLDVHDSLEAALLAQAAKAQADNETQGQEAPQGVAPEPEEEASGEDAQQETADASGDDPERDSGGDDLGGAVEYPSVEPEDGPPLRRLGLS
jgi:putative nucleotidyltransferase with HDIG domain